MISVIIPTLDVEATLPATLAALIPATVAGVVKQVVIVDGGSKDATLKIADVTGAMISSSEPGRGQQLRMGAASARQPWLLFLHADTVLAEGWEKEAAAFIEKTSIDGGPPRAAAFRFGLDDEGLGAGVVEFGVGLRCRVFRLPYGDQGLLIHRALYDDIGGYKPIALLEDVDIVSRIGWRRLRLLHSKARTSARRYRSDGYARRVLKNWTCLAMYFVGVPVKRIVRFYD